MGIDIYARWKGRTFDEFAKSLAGHRELSEVGQRGYLRECYHGGPYATMHLFGECFEGSGFAVIEAEVLRARLPRTLELVEERWRKVYQADAPTIKKAKADFTDFVALCERKEKEDGEPVLIEASY